MASHQSIGSGSSSKSEKSSSMGQKVLCYHKQIALLRTVKYDGPTKGKRFYGCSYYRNRGHADFSNGLMKLMKLVTCKCCCNRRIQKLLNWSKKWRS
ncbi:DNA topoisomerase 3-alpha [Bienertia sinuspersici]